MKGLVLLDTGPLVAYLDRRDRYHDWAKTHFGQIQPPQLTCEAVLTEACHLLCKVRGGTQAVIELLTDRIITVPFHLVEEVPSIAELLGRYANVPMSLADACLVRMAEQYAQGIVFTLDSDFKFYRTNGRQVIPTIIPEDQK